MAKMAKMMKKKYVIVLEKFTKPLTFREQYWDKSENKLKTWRMEGFKCPICDYERGGWGGKSVMECFFSHIVRTIMFRGDIKHIRLVFDIFGEVHGRAILKKISSRSFFVHKTINKFLKERERELESSQNQRELKK
jgi:hypothetical protein